jgi:hypothetical protein
MAFYPSRWGGSIGRLIVKRVIPAASVGAIRSWASIVLRMRSVSHKPTFAAPAALPAAFKVISGQGNALVGDLNLKGALLTATCRDVHDRCVEAVLAGIIEDIAQGCLEELLVRPHVGRGLHKAVTVEHKPRGFRMVSKGADGPHGLLDSPRELHALDKRHPRVAVMRQQPVIRLGTQKHRVHHVEVAANVFDLFRSDAARQPFQPHARAQEGMPESMEEFLGG